MEPDLRKLLIKIFSIKNVVYKPAHSNTPWVKPLLGGLCWCTFEFNGFELTVYGGDLGSPDNNGYAEKIKDYKCSFTLTHVVSKYQVRQVYPLLETNEILRKVLNARNQEMENYIQSIIEN